MAANQHSIGMALIGVGALHGQETGQVARQALEAQGHAIVQAIHIKDGSLQIKGELAMLSQKSSCQAILIHGGTQLSVRTSAYDVAERLLEKRLDGFGQILRHICFQELGSKAVHVRATAGLYQGRLLMVVPGDAPTLTLALERLIIPELSTLAQQIKRL